MSEEFAQLLLQLAKFLGRVRGNAGVDAERKLGGFVALLRLDYLSRAGDGVALVVEQRLDVQDGLDIAPAIEPLACAAFVRFELGKLALPETKNVGGDVAES